MRFHVPEGHRLLALQLQDRLPKLWNISQRSCISRSARQLHVLWGEFWLSKFYTHVSTFTFDHFHIWNTCAIIRGFTCVSHMWIKCVFVLKSVYFSLVHSHFIYGIEIYANTYAKYLDPLIKINNRILRVLQNKELKTPINQLYINHHTLPIPKLHDLHILLFMHKYNFDKNNLPTLFHNYFKLNSNVHDHNTRQKEMMHSEKFENSYGKRSIKYRGGMLWNKLPYTLRLYSSRPYFKES